MKTRVSPCVAAALLVAAVAGPAVAAERGKNKKLADAPPAREVELFAAMQSGELDVKFIPKSDREAKVIIKNQTKEPLSVKLPEAFAGVPVLAQNRLGGGVAGGGGNRGGNRGGGGSSYGGGGGMNQSMGGGMGGGMMGGGMGGMGGMGGGGFFNVAPEKAGEIKVATVCLEHGKKDPRPAVPYKIVPIEQFTDSAAVAELCKLVGSGQVNQRAAQAAAWHLSSGLSWQELANKQYHYLNAPNKPYFQRQELLEAVRIAEHAVAAADERSQPASES